MKKITSFILLFSLMTITTSANARCSITDFQQCLSCDELSEAIDINQPNAGDYYRGAYWNGLYMAYVRNCPNIGQLLLDHGASPVTGGYEGLMILEVSGSWPHNDQAINSKWVDLLLKYGATMNTPTLFGDQLTTTGKMDWLAGEGFPIDISYPSLLKKFANE